MPGSKIVREAIKKGAEKALKVGEELLETAISSTARKAEAPAKNASAKQLVLERIKSRDELRREPRGAYDRFMKYIDDLPDDGNLAVLDELYPTSNSSRKTSMQFENFYRMFSKDGKSDYSAILHMFRGKPLSNVEYLQLADKTYRSKKGVEFNIFDWFDMGNRNRASQKLTNKDVDTFISHVQNEYLDLADKLIEDGKLANRGGAWFGEVTNPHTGETLVINVDPMEYVVANSKAFKKSGLSWYGRQVTGVGPHHIDDLADNGILKSWTSNSNYVGNAYSTKSPRTGGNYPTRGTFFNVVADESNMPLGEVNPNMNNKIWDGSGAAESPNALDVYRNYIDKLTESLFPGSGHIDETRVYPKNTKVKALRGNNGDFDMSIPFIFSYNTNNKQNINETMA